MKKKLAFGIFIIIVCSFLFGYSFGVSNFNYGGYPGFSERKPMRPYSKDNYAAQSYSDDVDRYIKKVKVYLEGCDNDIKSIQEESDTALTTAKKVVNEYNDWVRTGI
jgi:hypothetical protein